MRVKVILGLTSIFIGASGLVLAIISFFKIDIDSISKDWKNSVIIILTILLLFTLISVIYYRVIRSTKQFYYSYNISIFGYPKSGKTTLINRLLQAIIEQDIKMSQYVPYLKGQMTILRVNENIGKLNKRIPIGRTTYTNRFLYRVNLESKKKSFFGTQNYRVEFGDFPGELSKEFGLSQHDAFNVYSDYYNWTKDCDAFIFMIDVASYLLKGKEYVENISTVIRIAWHNILNSNSEKMEPAKSTPVILVFNKMDLFRFYDVKNIEERIDELNNFAYSESSLPLIMGIDKNTENLSEFEKELKLEFQSLIKMFKTHSNNFHISFSSSFMKRSNLMYGLENLAKNILPKN